MQQALTDIQLSLPGSATSISTKSLQQWLQAVTDFCKSLSQCAGKVAFGVKKRSSSSASIESRSGKAERSAASWAAVSDQTDSISDIKQSARWLLASGLSSFVCALACRFSCSALDELSSATASLLLSFK